MPSHDAPRFLRFARSLALVSFGAVAASCHCDPAPTDPAAYITTDDVHCPSQPQPEAGCSSATNSTCNYDIIDATPNQCGFMQCSCDTPDGGDAATWSCFVHGPVGGPLPPPTLAS